MNQASFYWHDYETWGLNPALDRPSQFAGLRTDMDFNPVLDPDMFYCRLSDDYLPHPESAIITGITPATTQSQGIFENKFAAQINRQFSQANTCIVGYNSLRFDEEFSRYLLYRNFYDPYAYAWKNSNTRWDIIDLVRATYALRPEGINWPKNDQGLPSFRLELLTQANGICHANAHDASADVYATIAIAKLIKQKSPKIFDYYFQLRDKHKVKALIDVEQMTPLVHVSGMFGAAKGNTSLVAPIIWHPINRNAVVVVDLAQNISPLLSLSADQIRQRLYTKRDELGDNLPIPLKLVHINKCPFLATQKALLPENAKRLGINREACLANASHLKNHLTLVNTITDVYQKEPSFEQKNNVDTLLYTHFFSDDDKRIFTKIHQSSPQKLSDFNDAISDNRFNELLFRYRAKNFPETLTTDEQQRWQTHRQVMLNPTILTDYFSMLDSYSEQFKKDQKNTQIIDSLRQYANTLVTSLRPLID